jgi:hypothetical protein
VGANRVLTEEADAFDQGALRCVGEVIQLFCIDGVRQVAIVHSGVIAARRPPRISR